MTIDQYVFGEEVKEEDLQPGDLVFSNTGEGKIFYESMEFLSGYKVEKGIDHCGIYLGGGKVAHSSRYNGDGIEIQDLSASKQFKEIVAYGRVNATDMRYVFSIPQERLDLRIKEDLTEEIARVYGYENIKSIPLEIECSREINKKLYYKNKIRKILNGVGYAEVLGYTFTGEGEVEILKSLALGKDYLRTNLTKGISEALVFNERNKDLLGIDRVRIYEFGNVFTKDKEWTSFSIGLGESKSKDEINVLEILNKELGLTLEADIFSKKGGIIELNFDEILDKLPAPTELETSMADESPNVEYKTISPYPFILRDIAIWVPENTKSIDVLELIKNNAGELLIRAGLFDEFKKDGKVSFAFNLVFQSDDKTLTDDEINQIMKKIATEMEANDWEVR